MEKKPNCYECKHRGNVPGDAHSCCKHPKAGSGDNPLMALMAIFASVGRVAPVMGEGAKGLDVKFNDWGVQQGWCTFPYNFDPVWLENCDGFEKRS